MKEIRYIFNVTGVLAFIASLAFAYLYFIEESTKYASEYFLMSLVMMVVGEVFILCAPTKHDIDEWIKEYNK